MWFKLILNIMVYTYKNMFRGAVDFHQNKEAESYKAQEQRKNSKRIVL